MKIIKRDIWEFYQEGRTVVIPTNGIVGKNGLAIMGKGLAKQAVDHVYNLAKMLGDELKHAGNRVYCFPQYRIVTFPTKHHWINVSDLNLIVKSAHELAYLSSVHPLLFPVVMPKVGCGEGGLAWEDVESLIAGPLENLVEVVEPVGLVKSVEPK